MISIFDEVPPLGSVSSAIAVANRNGICTAGFMTFGCACPKCLDAMHKFTDELLLELGKEI